MWDARNEQTYPSLPNRGDVSAINFMRIFHPHLCYFSHHVYKKWPKFRTTTLIVGTTFIKIKESSSSASHNSVISVTASLKIKERFRFLHKSVKIKLKCMTMHTEKQIFGVWDSYKLLWKHLLPEVYTTEYRCAFNSIEFNRIKNLVSLYFVMKLRFFNTH